MIDPIKDFKSTFAREAGITCRGVGNVALVLAPVFAVSAMGSTGDASGLSAGLSAMAAGGSAVGGYALRKVGNFISQFSSQPL